MQLGIIANPMSGRDVRRVTAKASTSAHHDKQQLVTRLVLGALENGIDKVYLGNEPFRISERAVENLDEKNKIQLLSFPLSHTAADTQTLVEMMWDEGCRVFIVLGGDGTNRIVAKTKPDAIILPLSTGTNNVFPLLAEASVAGAAAALIANQTLDFEEHCNRCKLLKISINGEYRDLALIDAVVILNDHLGSLLPYKEKDIKKIFLTRAEPASVGMSPIGGFMMPCYSEDDFGVMVECGETKSPNNTVVRVPLSPGLYGDIAISSVERMTLGESYDCPSQGILAFDGDRSIKLEAEDKISISVQRDGPWVINPYKVLHTAAERKLLRK